MRRHRRDSVRRVCYCLQVLLVGLQDSEGKQIEEPFAERVRGSLCCPLFLLPFRFERTGLKQFKMGMGLEISEEREESMQGPHSTHL